jgi:hypothetical protein
MPTLQDVSKKLGVPPAWLWSLIQFESRGDPAAKNKITGARGLIQFMPATARDMGYKDADEIVKKYPTFDAQLEKPVFDYLKKYAPFPTKQSLYMSVFYPAARTWQPERKFSALVRKQNPGIDTVQSYIDHVEGRFVPKKAIGFLSVGLIGIIAYMLFKTILPK